MKERLNSLYLSTHAKIHTILLVSGLVITAIGAKIREFGSLHPVAWIGLGVITLSMLWRFAFIKCPHCGSGLYGVSRLPQHCPDCGEKLV